jgi:radical SAM protein with 4Fe4S-binding SPASM domain|tara:strand:+ start:74 stop:1165 length:1092 start_codon:yes stop_codon:yes gene_type:complete
MYDINFYKNSFSLKNDITSGKLSLNEIDNIEKELEVLRDKTPTIFNIETTNYCNMKCVMCPRTLYMQRKNIWIDDNLFEKMLDNVKIHKDENLNKFWDWLEKDAKFDPREVSENGFYFSVVSRCLILHGYGEPFLDKFLIKRLKVCKERNIPTYFSCTPATMTVEKAVQAMENELTVLKFSLDAMDDEKIKLIRGKRANYNESIEKIHKLLEIKKERGFKTLLVPCMIAFDNDSKTIELHKKFLNFWKGKDVYTYVKSQDNRWQFEQNEKLENKSHYAKQYCEYPWTSATIMAEGNVVPCTQISNNEIVLGNVNEKSLKEIWNGEEYKKLRKMHITGKFPKGHKCSERCDQVKLFEYFKKNKN